MQSRIIGTFWVTTICCIVSVLALTGVPAECDAMSITPSRIILNVECAGSSQDIQAIFFSVGLASYKIGSFTGKFYFAGEEEPVCTTDSFHYCLEHDNLLVSFDRGAIQEYIERNLLADGIYKVEVSCSFSVTDSAGKTTFREFERSDFFDFVEILAPGNKEK